MGGGRLTNHQAHSETKPVIMLLLAVETCLFANVLALTVSTDSMCKGSKIYSHDLLFDSSGIV